MNPTIQTLLGALPPFKGQRIVISKKQSVPDIINEVCAAHKRFATYYDKIALYFNHGTTQAICDNLYNFCKRYIKYQEEPDKDQRTQLPTAILERGFGDCKHYAGFIAGVLDGLNRLGRKIDWRYRFASYRIFSKIPHHVFVVVNDDGNEIWIDPTPGAEISGPMWIIDKKPSVMLTSTISGIGQTAVDNYPMVWLNGKWWRVPPDVNKVGLIEEGIELINNISQIFAGAGSTGKRAAQKMFDMFPLLPGSTASVIQSTIDAIRNHMSADPKGVADAEWGPAYQDVLRQYTNALALVSKGYAMPQIVVPPIGSMSFMALPPGVPNAANVKPNTSSSVQQAPSSAASPGGSPDGSMPAKDNSMLILVALVVGGFILYKHNS